MGETRRRSKYRVFLLRMWDEPRDPPADPVVRFSLEDTTGMDRRGFVDADALVAYLAALGEPASTAPSEVEDQP